ncbi:hypothetical protein N657DRAFT_640382 [Parathielavia appendiculata]|uniref:Uncharacterized protein n=1 Tax=Parathielavia appendiculata TaxID=2587402 RepID=A0AAN6UB17_9PEZI|nr:hypothetical protein N657DRAFT_640382 [Parathielavia appendiculata]
MSDIPMASGIQHPTQQNEILAQLAQIPQDQLANFLRVLAGMSTVAQGGNLTNILPASSAAGTGPDTPAKPSSRPAATGTREDDSLHEFDNTSTHRSRHVANRSRRDMVSASVIEDDDLEDDTPRLGRQPARTTTQKNEYNWVLGDQTLPVAALSGVTPPSRNPLMYTAYILNNLARSSPDENLLWSILRAGGGIRYIVRLLKVKERAQGPDGTSYAVLKWGRPQQRTAIAAYAKLAQTNNGVSCTTCQNASSVGPFRSCIATGEFSGACTNCQYHSRAAQCSLRNGADETGTVQRGIKRARTDISPSEQRPRPRTSASGFRHDSARLQNEDHIHQSGAAPSGTSAKQLFRILFCSMPTAELEAIVKDGRLELDRRGSTI